MQEKIVNGRILGDRDKTTEVELLWSGWVQHVYITNTFLWKDQTIQLVTGKVMGKADALRLGVLSWVYLAVEGSSQKREAVFLFRGGTVQSLWACGEWALPGGRLKALSGLPKVAAFRGGSAKCSRAQSQLGSTGKYDWSPSFYINFYLMAFA